MAHFIALYGVWLVAAFIALESIGFPLPAEAALIAAGLFAASNPELNIWFLVAVGICAAIVGEFVGFWVGRLYGYQLLHRYGDRFGLTQDRITIGQWLFVRYGGRFVFVARFLPFLRNMAAVLAGTNAMAPHNFYAASAAAAVVWIMGYGLAAYSFGSAIVNMASSAAAVLGFVGLLLAFALPVVVLRHEKRLLAKAQRELARQRAEAREPVLAPNAAVVSNIVNTQA